MVTAADTPKVRYIYLGGPFSDRYPLALDRVRFVGEPVAAVAADTAEAAEAAAALVRVDYEVLPALLTPEAAMAPGAVAIHPPEQCLGGPNVALRSERRYGDLEAGMRAAAHVFEHRFRYPAVLSCPMETNAAVCDVFDGVLHVWTPTQVPQFVQKELAHVLDLPLERVRVREVAVGGGFGARSKVCEQEAIAALLALKTGRPGQARVHARGGVRGDEAAPRQGRSRSAPAWTPRAGSWRATRGPSWTTARTRTWAPGSWATAGSWRPPCTGPRT